MYDDAKNFSYKCIKVMKETIPNVAEAYQTTADLYASIGFSLGIGKLKEATNSFSD